MKKFKPTFEKDYNFYLANRHAFDFSGSDIKAQYASLVMDEKGKTAKECFHKLDSEGKLLPCKEPELLLDLLKCKAAVNLQIKIWAESRAEYTLSLFELKEYLDHYQAPEWVLKAVEKQKVKIIRKWDNETRKKHFESTLLNIVDDLEDERQRQELTGDTSKVL